MDSAVIPWIMIMMKLVPRRTSRCIIPGQTDRRAAGFTYYYTRGRCWGFALLCSSPWKLTLGMHPTSNGKLFEHFHFLWLIWIIRYFAGLEICSSTSELNYWYILWMWEGDEVHLSHRGGLVMTTTTAKIHQIFVIGIAPWITAKYQMGYYLVIEN